MNTEANVQSLIISFHGIGPKQKFISLRIKKKNVKASFLFIK